MPLVSTLPERSISSPFSMKLSTGISSRMSTSGPEPARSWVFSWVSASSRLPVTVEKPSSEPSSRAQV